MRTCQGRHERPPRRRGARRGRAVRVGPSGAAVRRRGRSATLSLARRRAAPDEEVDGRSLDQRALVAPDRPLARRQRAAGARRSHPAAQPDGDRVSLGPVVLINRETNRLYLFHGNELWRSFPVATGQAVYPTPTGPLRHRREVGEPLVVSAHVELLGAGAEARAARARTTRSERAGWGARPPGSGSTARTAPSSIGYSVSHGCIRMQVTDSEWLFEHVSIGTTVFIV